jgi:anti-anti-sigma factor
MKLVLDLSEISYVNSAGLRMLLSLKKQMKSAGGKFIVCSLRPEVMEIMKICGFDHVLEFAKDDEDALRQF